MSIWADAIHFSVRLGGGDDRLCCLVMVGVRLAGTKELIGLTDGYRELTVNRPGCSGGS